MEITRALCVSEEWLGHSILLAQVRHMLTEFAITKNKPLEICEARKPIGKVFKRPPTRIILRI
uniref:Uncharacterized protein n=1 Tax=Oryza glumipatula TaxID=40148 RepID=A0A0E0AJP5_9ORYZ